jgi:hypothetical protein
MESLGIFLLTFCDGDNRIKFDFHAPFGVDELSHDDHCGGGQDFAKDFAVDPAYGLPVGGVGQVHSRSDYVLERCSGAIEDVCGDFEDLAGLGFYVGFVCAYGAGAGDVDGVMDADGSGEADDGFVGGCAGEILAGHGRFVHSLGAEALLGFWDYGAAEAGPFKTD